MSSTANYFLTLRRSPLLRGVPDIAIETLLNECVAMRCSSGYIAFQKGDIGNEAYFILDGQVEVTISALNSEYLLKRKLEKGMLLGEIALFTGGRRSATAIVKTDAVLLCMPRDQFINLIRAWPEIAIALLGALSDRLIKAENPAKEL